MNDDSRLLRAELDHLIDRTGLNVSEQRRADLVSTYTDLKKQLALLRGPHDPRLEPSTVFRLSSPKLGP